MKVMLAVRTVLEFDEKFPEIGAAATGGRGKAKGKLDLCQFCEGEGFTLAAIDEDDGRIKIDFEAFVVAMETQRKWTPDTAFAEWKDLLC